MTRGLRMWGLWLVLGALLGACSSNNDNNGGGGGGGGGDGGTSIDAGTDGGTEAVITIENFTYSPDNLEVKAGQMVRVVNMDSAPHSVTSEATDNAFTPGAVNGVSFDTGSFTGEHTFTIPSNAPSGTVIPYFCTVHLSGMRNTGHITIMP